MSSFCSTESSMPMSMESRMSPSIGSQPKNCNPFSPPYPDIDFPLHASCSFDPMSSSSAIGDLKESDSLGSAIHEYQFPSLLAARRVSFKAKSGTQSSRVFDGFSISPATPVFQSDYCREVVGARQSEHKEMPCVNINLTIGFPVSHTIPDLESKQKGVAIAEGGASSVMRCNEELNLDGSECCLDGTDSNPVERLHGLDSTVQIKSASSELLPSDGRSTYPMDPAGLMEGITPVSQGVQLECPSVASHRGQIQLPPYWREGDVTGTKSGSGLPTEHAGGPTGITWSSVVTKNTLGGHNAMECPIPATG